MKKKVTYNKFRSYLTQAFKVFHPSPGMFFDIKIINRHVLIMGFTFLLFIISVFGHRWALVGAITIVCTLLYFYFQTKKMTRNLMVKRTFNKKVIEKENLNVKYEIINYGDIPILNIKFSEDNEISNGELIHSELSNGVKARTRVIINKSIIADSGMGKKNFSGIKVYITDPFNLFEFLITFDDQAEVFVYPKVEELPSFKSGGSMYSIISGMYDVDSKGESTNFKGVRKYNLTDPIKKINWKLSQKYDDILVNEFEHNVNNSSYIFLEMFQGHHFGIGRYSTWEYCKDIGLGIAAKEIQKGNMVKIASGNQESELSGGADQLYFLEYLIGNLELDNEKNGVEKISQLYDQVVPYANVFFVTPLLESDELIERIHYLDYFIEKKCNIHICFVQFDPFFLNHLKTEIRGPLQNIHQSGENIKQELFEFCRQREIFVHEISITSKMSYRQQFEKQIHNLETNNEKL